jgi:hypothetical protein
MIKHPVWKNQKGGGAIKILLAAALIGLLAAIAIPLISFQRDKGGTGQSPAENRKAETSGPAYFQSR